ncbi:hypothetical protein ACIQXI_09745 [Lysinibacillus sp. NPDC097195]|uniref:hypothetical protein n=1 Tax=Lysinibacillus sp. NPDC097195 TaxID=3364141 RepID=UPI003800412E
MSKSKIFAIILLVLFVGAFIAGMYTITDVQIESTYKLDEQSIIERNGERFLVIDDRELALSKRYYDKINLEKYNEYKVKYVYNTLKKNDGEVVALKRYGEQPWGQ